MRIFKFGGASVKDAASVKNVCSIIQQFKDDDLVVVISAMGKTTNKLEAIIEAWLKNKDHKEDLLQTLLNEHLQVIDDLFNSKKHPINIKITELFKTCADSLIKYKSSTYNFIYDQVIGTGELASTLIVHAYLNELLVMGTLGVGASSVSVNWLDAKLVVKTNKTYREAIINWDLTTQKIQTLLGGKKGITITQGFIASDDNNFTTTLGREGSDYSAAIFAYALNADAVHIWKDVDGILSADPKKFPEATFIPTINYNDAIEMTYYGAKVIHAKTIKPLQNKNIPLIVRPFGNVKNTGTIISNKPNQTQSPPIIILKEKQILLKITTKDFSFMVEKNLSYLFDIFSKHLVKINLFQIAAIKVFACVNKNPQKVPDLITDLEKLYKVSIKKNLKVLTIRNYNEAALKKYAENHTIILEQKGSNTVQYVLVDREA